MTTTPLRHCTACAAAIPSGALACPQCGADAPTEIALDAAPPSGARATNALEANRAALQHALGAAFEVRRLVGRGGFGEVWEVYDTRLARAVAVKVLRPELAASAAFRERFRREARAVAQLRHPGIVPIYHVGEAQGLVYFIMPLVEGVTLKAALEQEGRLSAGEAIRILAEASGALREAHRRGIVHRDLKPENFMLEGSERHVVLMDFGIAQFEDPDRELTGVGLVLGSPEYMSPEQATGTRQLDGRSDIYSLGMVGYRMLAGKLPFASASAREALAHHVHTSPEPLANFAAVPQGLSDAVMRCLAKQPGERWQSADELLAALGPNAPRELAVAAVASPPVGVPAATQARASSHTRRRRVAVLGVPLTLLVLGAGGWLALRWRDLRGWERTAVAVTVAYRQATDSLRVLAAAFRRGAVSGAEYLAAQEALQSTVDQRIAATFGPILDDLSRWPDALRRDVEDVLRETVAATLPGGALALQASGAAGCVMERGPNVVALQDSASGSNCWWSVASAPPVGEPVEYVLAFRVPSKPAADAGIGLAWCRTATECRVIFLWSRGRVEWAAYRPGGGLSHRQLGARLPPLVGLHHLRVRIEEARARVWLDDAVVLEHAGRNEARLLTEAGVLRVVAQNAAIELVGPGALRVVGSRP